MRITPRLRGERREEIEIHTADGQMLRAAVREASGGRAGVAVLAHAMMARKSEFERPLGDANAGLAHFLVERGWRTIALDFRGHGDSGPGAASGASCTYDDLVSRDLPAVIECARARAKRLPVVVFGHSLGGHAALAAQGIGKLGADAIVCIAANVWLPRLEPSRIRWAIKRATLAAATAVCEQRGYFPARALRLGSDDETAAMIAALARFARTDEWASEDGAIDYLAGLSSVTVPIVQIASEEDRLTCPPACAERFLDRCGGPRHFELVRRADDGGAAPGHMALVTSAGAVSAWGRAERWVRDEISRRGGRGRGKSSPG